MSGTCNHVLSDHCGCSAAPAASHADVAQRYVELVSEDELLARYDSWSSALTGIGNSAYDKRQCTEIVVPVIDYSTAIALWRADPMAARAVELLPAACFARGYELSVTEGDFDQEFLDEVTDRMDELKVNELVETAYKYERAYGGAAIYMGVDDGGAQDEPLVPSRIRSLDFLTVMEPLEIYPSSYYQDPNHPKYGMPEYYRQQAFTISGAGTVIGVTDRRAPAPTNRMIHESRLIVFGGVRVSRYQRNNSMMGPLWGDSVFVRIMESLRDYNIAWGAAGLLPIDFAQSVISVENLMQLVGKNPDKIAARLRAMEMMRSNARAILIDSKEKFQRESTNITGLPDLLHLISQRMAADIGVPFSMLLGISPSGLGQPGQNDVAMFQDNTRSAQKRRLTPPIKFLARIVMSTMRKRKLPQRWGIEWCNLVHQNDKDIAETRLTQARTDSMYIKMGALKPDEVRESRWRRRYSFETRVDKGPAPGFIAPLPAGVIPKADPAEGVVRELEATAAKQGSAANGNARAARTNKPVGPNAHIVGGYARRNPQQPALGAAPKEGGDKTPDQRADEQMTIALEMINANLGAAGSHFTANAILASALNSRRARHDKDLTAKIITLDIRADFARRAATSENTAVITACDRAVGQLTAAHADADGGGTRRVFAGLPIIVESPRGSFRHWTDADGSTGKTKMRYDYGYIEGVKGADGDSVDVYVGPNENASHAYVVHQNKVPDFMLYDEDKVMLGFDSPHHARDAYLAHRDDDDRAFGGMTPMSMDEFRTNYLGSGLAQLHSQGSETDAATAVLSAESTVDDREELEHHDFIKKRGNKWVIISERTGKSLGEYDTKQQAVERLRQIEGHKEDEISGGWGEQEKDYEVDRPETKKPEGDPAWNATLETLRSEDE